MDEIDDIKLKLELTIGLWTARHWSTISLIDNAQTWILYSETGKQTDFEELEKLRDVFQNKVSEFLVYLQDLLDEVHKLNKKDIAYKIGLLNEKSGALSAMTESIIEVFKKNRAIMIDEKIIMKGWF